MKLHPPKMAREGDEMPGLVGIVSLNGGKIDLSLMPAMRDAIRHRDWYDVDDYVNARGTVAISRVNLGIINQEKQPYSARGGGVKVFLHGEICNDEVADSDPLEFIYRQYEKKGVHFASFLNGSFVIVIVDETEDIVLIANDRTAAKPLFTFNDGQAMYFGPEMKSLLLVPALERKLNLAAVADFLTNGHFTTEHTLIEGLETVDKATVLKLTTGGVARHRYWQFEFEREGKDLGPDYYQARLAELLRKAVTRRLRNNNTYGILLSGGYDSRAILGCYLEERPSRELHTISWGREEDIPDSDCAVARRLARKLGAQHGFYKLTAEEIVDGFRDFVLLGEGLTDFPESYDVFHRIREQQHVDIVLRGDECFGFSRWLKVHDEYTMFLSLNLATLQSIERYRKVLKPYYHQLFCELDAETAHHVSLRCSAKNIHNRKDFFYLDARIKYYLNPLNCVKNFAIESFTPLLDRDILDFVCALPVRYRLGKNFWRKTVVKMFPELYEEVAQRHNMIDWASSFKGSPELERFVYQQLVEEHSAFSEFINVDGLRNELDAFFATPVDPAAKTSVRAGALELLETAPTVYSFVHKCSYDIRKRRGKVRKILPVEQLIRRLLILKVWGDVFLDYPVVPKSYII
jgi:asparagine synthetase B (glutamine-hydrolysing)